MHSPFSQHQHRGGATCIHCSHAFTVQPASTQMWSNMHSLFTCIHCSASINTEVEQHAFTVQPASTHRWSNMHSLFSQHQHRGGATCIHCSASFNRQHTGGATCIHCSASIITEVEQRAFTVQPASTHCQHKIMSVATSVAVVFRGESQEKR